VTQLIPLVDAIPPIGGKPGAPLRVPKLVMGDRGYDSDPHRMRLSGKAIATCIARRGAAHGSGLGGFQIRSRTDDRAAASVPSPAHAIREAR